MDPLSITSTIISITATCLATTKALNDLRDKYTHAQLTISSICSECTVISASLSRIQSLVLHAADPVSVEGRYRPELDTAFDTALTGCKIVLAVLDDEVQKLSSNEVGADLDTKTKIKYLWKEDTMKELLTQLRGQQTALNLLIQAIQMESLNDISELLQTNNSVLQNLTQRTLKLRDSHPRVRPPSSILDSSTYNRDSFLSGGGRASTVTEFDFDDVIMHSDVYRRALAGASPKKASAQDVDVNDTSDQADGNTAGRADVLKKDANQGTELNAKTPQKIWEVTVENTKAQIFDSFKTLVDTKKNQETYSKQEAARLDAILQALQNLGSDFDDELRAIREWFRVLGEAERITAFYHLARDASPDCRSFLSSVLS